METVPLKLSLLYSMAGKYTSQEKQAFILLGNLRELLQFLNIESTAGSNNADKALGLKNL